MVAASRFNLLNLSTTADLSTLAFDLLMGREYLQLQFVLKESMWKLLRDFTGRGSQI
jgi:hypothetical protein